MKKLIWKVCCLGFLLFGNVLCGFAQPKQTTEQQLTAVTADLKTKTLEYNWKLAEAYAEYCKNNTKFISWNNLPATFRQIIELDYPEELEPYRLKSEECQQKLDDYLNTHDEYVKLTKESKQAFTDEDKKINKAEALKYMVNSYRQDNRLMPVSFISYSVLSELQYKGSELELMKSELRILESLQQKLLENISREKYGLEPEEESEK